MEPFLRYEGVAAAMDRADVDTDQIIPKQFLKRIERTGFGPFLFFDWRYLADNQPNPAFELNQTKAAGAGILLAGRNFGCGSSREHAPWALHDYGFRVIIASSFADIFYNNCFKNGMLPIKLEESAMRQLFAMAARPTPLRLTVDLVEQRVHAPEGVCFNFEVDSFRKHCLINGLDDIGLTLQFEQKISQYEAAHGM